MNIFLDANVLVSVFNKEYPVFSYSSRILSLSLNKRYRLFTSPVCLAIAFYFSEKKSGSLLARKKIELLEKNISITDVGRKQVSDTLADKRILDFEDGIEYFSALYAKCQLIITENVSDFHFSKMEVLNSK